MSNNNDNIHPNRIYPWEKWFKSKKFTLKKGEDYSCMSHGMVSQIRKQAGDRGIKVAVKVKEDEIIVTRRYRR